MCADPDRDWYSQRFICRAEQERLVAQRRFDALHEAMPYHDGTRQNWSKDYSDAFPFRYDDGVHIFTASADYDPDDDFLSDKNAVPTKTEVK